MPSPEGRNNTRARPSGQRGQTQDGEYFVFGGQRFPLETLTHLFLMGGTGSGKTVSIMLAAELLKKVGTKSHRDGSGGWRAIVYDPKSDLVPVLRAMGLGDRLVVTNPFLGDAWAWDMSADVTGPASATQAASLLLPANEKRGDTFFDDAACCLVAGTMLALHHVAPRNWTLRHVCLVLRSVNHLRRILGRCPDTRHIAELLLCPTREENRMLISVMATLMVRIADYEVIAALWDRAADEGRCFSLRGLLGQERILVLGAHEECRAGLDAVNRVLIKRVSELLLSRQPAQDERTFVIIDECREAGALPGLSSLLLRGRTYNVVCWLAAQDILGVKEVYGENTALEMTAQCNFQGYLKLNSQDSAEFAARQFGQVDLIEYLPNAHEGMSSSGYSSGRGFAAQRRLQDTVLPVEFLNMRPPNSRSGLAGMYRTPFGSFRSEYRFADRLPRPESGGAARRLRPEEDQYLKDFTPEELERFGLEGEPHNARNARGEGPPRRPRDRRRQRAGGYPDSAQEQM